MDIFPTHYSTLSATALNSKLQQRYDMQNTYCRLLIRNVSDTYVWETPTGNYIFKIYRDAHRKLEEIKGEVELLNLLMENGASISYPVKDVEGNCIQAFNAAEGTRYGVLFTWARGQVVYGMTDAQLIQVGHEMAKIHNISSRIELQHQRKDYSVYTALTRPLELIEPAFAGLTDEYAYLKNTAAQTTAYLGQIDTQQFSYGYCHFDFFPKNFHFNEEGKPTFFDFDFMGKGLLAYDITSFYIHYFLEVHFKKVTLQEAQQSFNVFVESYRELRPITNEELKAIPYLGFAFWLFYMGFYQENFDDWSNTFWGPRFIRERVELMRQWMSHALTVFA